ncbi:MAG: type II toxin-antitoxin system Phd/YefM family antitoxin [Actinomycetota bacterium]
MDIGVYDAKARFSELVRAVEAGGEVTITRHGRPVARLVPVGDTAGREREVAEFLARVRALRAGVTDPPTGEEIVRWIREGRERGDGGGNG